MKSSTQLQRIEVRHLEREGKAKTMLSTYARSSRAAGPPIVARSGKHDAHKSSGLSIPSKQYSWPSQSIQSLPQAQKAVRGSNDINRHFMYQSDDRKADATSTAHRVAANPFQPGLGGRHGRDCASSFACHPPPYGQQQNDPHAFPSDAIAIAFADDHQQFSQVTMTQDLQSVPHSESLYCSTDYRSRNHGMISAQPRQQVVRLGQDSLSQGSLRADSTTTSYANGNGRDDGNHIHGGLGHEHLDRGGWPSHSGPQTRCTPFTASSTSSIVGNDSASSLATQQRRCGMQNGLPMPQSSVAQWGRSRHLLLTPRPTLAPHMIQVLANTPRRDHPRAATKVLATPWQQPHHPEQRLTADERTIQPLLTHPRTNGNANGSLAPSSESNRSIHSLHPSPSALQLISKAKAEHERIEKRAQEIMHLLTEKHEKNCLAMEKTYKEHMSAIKDKFNEKSEALDGKFKSHCDLVNALATRQNDSLKAKETSLDDKIDMMAEKGKELTEMILDAKTEHTTRVKTLKEESQKLDRKSQEVDARLSSLEGMLSVVQAAALRASQMVASVNKGRDEIVHSAVDIVTKHLAMALPGCSSISTQIESPESTSKFRLRPLSTGSVTMSSSDDSTANGGCFEQNQESSKFKVTNSTVAPSPKNMVNANEGKRPTAKARAGMAKTGRTPFQLQFKGEQNPAEGSSKKKTDSQSKRRRQAATTNSAAPFKSFVTPLGKNNLVDLSFENQHSSPIRQAAPKRRRFISKTREKPLDADFSDDRFRFLSSP